MTFDPSFEQIDDWLQSRSADDVERALTLLRSRDAAGRDDALVQYLIGSAYDSAGLEGQAMPHYQRAFTIGVEQLPAELQPELYVQAGSTLRNLQRLDEARQLLEAGIARFPAYRALRVFLALVEASAGDTSNVTRLLFEVVVMDDDASLARFRRSLRAYVAELRAVRPAD